MDTCNAGESFLLPKEWQEKAEELQVHANSYVTKRSEKGKGKDYRCLMVWREWANIGNTRIQLCCKAWFGPKPRKRNPNARKYVKDVSLKSLGLVSNGETTKG